MQLKCPIYFLKMNFLDKLLNESEKITYCGTEKLKLPSIYAKNPQTTQNNFPTNGTLRHSKINTHTHHSAHRLQFLLIALQFPTVYL